MPISRSLLLLTHNVLYQNKLEQGRDPYHSFEQCPNSCQQSLVPAYQERRKENAKRRRLHKVVNPALAFVQLLFMMAFG